MRTSVAITNSSSTRRLTPSCPIGRMAQAESVIALLARLDTEAFPLEEKLAVGRAQSAAMDAWLDAYGKAAKGS